MIVLRYGRTGRLARLVEGALRIAAPGATHFVAQRAGGFCADGDPAVPLDTLLATHPETPVLWVDASVDHRSTASLIAHETLKRQTLDMLVKHECLYRAIGFSSGITQVPASAIKASAPHMQEYRTQKLLQEKQFAQLNCPFLLPQLFTLIGPITYSGQSAAWAQVLRARVSRESSVTLQEPHARKAWVSEFQVFLTVLAFLQATDPRSSSSPLVSGAFTLAQISSIECLGLPAMKWSQGNADGWMVGDYLPTDSTEKNGANSLVDALLHALFPTPCHS